MKEHQEVEGARTPPKKDDKLSSGLEQDSTPSVSVGEAPVMEDQEPEGDEFPKVERHRSVSPEFVVKPEAVMTHIMEIWWRPRRPSMLRTTCSKL